MSADLLAGLGLVLGAGVLNGSFAAPMKFTRGWAWENTWLAWSLIALVLFPIPLTLATVPDAARIYREAQAPVLVWVLAAGAGWGLSQVLFGLGIARTGMALGFAIVVGLAAAAGSLIPLLLRPEGAFHAAGLRVMGGVLIVLGGVALCSYAGGRRDAPAESGSARPSRASWVGILLCIGAGLGGSMINVGMVFGAPLAAQAQRSGVAAAHRTNAVWLPLLAAGFVSTAIYCARRLAVNQTWNRFLGAGMSSNWLLAAAMAACWFGSVEIYGVAALRLGEWGPILGWPVFLSSSIIAANVWGLASGEWKHAAAAARRLMLAGVGVLVAAIFVIGILGRTI